MTQANPRLQRLDLLIDTLLVCQADVNNCDYQLFVNGKEQICVVQSGLVRLGVVSRVRLRVTFSVLAF